MGYVAVQGGVTAIENAEQLSSYLRLKGRSTPINIKQIQDQMRLLVDRVMGEGGLYSPFHAALAIKQAEGDPIEASFYLRAYRSTLRRLTDSLPLDTESARVSRRISSAFKDIPGGQILGASTDYKQKILEFDLVNETSETAERCLADFEQNHHEESGLATQSFTKVVDLLINQGLVKQAVQTEYDPVIDITQDTVNFPLHRSGRLQIMARSETGGVLALAYSSMRGYGSIHPTIAELRVMTVPVKIPHPHRKNTYITVGSIELTEVEIVAKFGSDNEGEKPYFTLGYGVCFGSNELKAISMAVLDRTLKETEAKAPAQDQEFVLMHIDGIESSGFCAHFKLPHYITFQSGLNNLRTTQQQVQNKNDRQTEKQR